MTDTDPFSEIERAFDVLTDQFGANLGAVPTDLVETDDEFVVRMDLPGFDTEDIDVTLAEDRKLSVTAERDESAESADGQYLTRERRRQSLSRTVRLPGPVEDDAAASYEDGVLTVHLPKIVEDEGDDGTDIPVN
ncbi:Hsp20/alpha crystallin family protein [Haloarcula sp. GH36]|uniref:Hsp20/alpha crystallin family protein n=1 Tax=Haloarcula montana TaxID=3111776 RepID=UPI002D773862|nr:Hsp20/alpha crystallin family protein [Haloarcula sp. GH36]